MMENNAYEYLTQISNENASGMPAVSGAPVKARAKWLLPSIIVGGLAVIVVIVVLIVKVTGDAAERRVQEEQVAREDLQVGSAYEAVFDEKDDLNPLYAMAAGGGEHVGYETTLDYTKLYEYVPRGVCALLEVECSELLNPESAGFVKVEPLNTNAISYYLDSGYVVAISAYGEWPYTEQGEVVVVYAVDYTYGKSFVAFVPSADGEVPVRMELRRDALVNGVIGIPNFYVSGKKF